MPVVYPMLIKEMVGRGVKKKDMARDLGICYKTMLNKLNGRAPFTWPETQLIRRQYFPDLTVDELFQKAGSP